MKAFHRFVQNSAIRENLTPGGTRDEEFGRHRSVWRSAAPYTYNGGEHEGTRVGYTFAYHLFLDGRGYIVVDNVTYSVEKAP
ncbi:hypothetical protein [Paenibacillus elgii]|uniref:hypothetical protein n=1 Tax=Paenibacillus elgii TaxID=189691 RepID=UPI0013D25517|nr:hypothetical protein [Paenibacillus elgii]